MAADAQGQHQRAGSGQHVPEIGAIAQAGEEEQVVQQQGEDQPVGHAEQQVALAAVFQQFVVAPEPQRKGVAAGIVAAQVDAQRPIAGRELEQRMTIGVVAALGEGHRFAAAMFAEPAALVGEVQAQVVQAGAGDFQPPAAGYRLGSRRSHQTLRLRPTLVRPAAATKRPACSVCSRSSTARLPSGSSSRSSEPFNQAPLAGGAGNSGAARETALASSRKMTASRARGWRTMTLPGACLRGRVR